MQACGTVFWYKDPLKDMLLRAGVPDAMYKRYEEEAKFKIARHILGELDKAGNNGWQVQHNIAGEFAAMSGIPDASQTEIVPFRHSKSEKPDPSEWPKPGRSGSYSVGAAQSGKPRPVK